MNSIVDLYSVAREISHRDAKQQTLEVETHPERTYRLGLIPGRSMDTIKLCNLYDAGESQ